MSVNNILFIKFESDRRPDRSGVETGAAAPGECITQYSYNTAGSLTKTILFFANSFL